MFCVDDTSLNYLKAQDNLVKKGWVGLGFCTLCKKSPDIVDHLMTTCNFPVTVWEKVCHALKISHVWEGENFDHCVFKWYKNYKDFPILLAIIPQKIQYARNVSIFEYHPQDEKLICQQVINVENKFCYRSIFLDKPIVMKEYQHFGAIGYFDSATKDGFYVVGVVLLIKSLHSFNFKLHCGNGTIMKA